MLPAGCEKGPLPRGGLRKRSDNGYLQQCLGISPDACLIVNLLTSLLVSRSSTKLLWTTRARVKHMETGNPRVRSRSTIDRAASRRLSQAALPGKATSHIPNAAEVGSNYVGAFRQRGGV